MVVEIGRPSQKGQKSRKGKKAWRKNIDIEDVEQNLDDQREQEIVLGPKNDALFTVDKTASEEGLTKEMKKERRLKSHEILYARSAVPALVSNHKRKDKPKSKVIKDVKGLLERAGFSDKSVSQAQLERDGLLKANEAADLWGESEKPNDTKPKPNLISVSPATKRKPGKPEPPIPGTIAVELPSAGLSYNPALEDWKATVLAEHAKIEKAEEQHLRAEEEKARIEAVIAETEAKLDDSESESESEEEHTPEELVKLSVNPPASNKRKTRTQRNKERRHKQWLYELSQLKQKREFMKSLLNQKSEANSSPQPPKEKAPKRKLKAHSNYPVMEEPLAIKLSDELDDSLRRLKPEGNLIKERLRSFQARGIVEARVPVKKRKTRHKMVEKHSFKHFEKEQ